MKFLFKINAALLTLFVAAAGILSYFASGEALTVMNAGVELPIIMYHSVLKDADMSGEFIVTPSEVESDIKFLKRHGYTCISMRDAIAYVEAGAPLPEKPVILTFDDGCYNNYGYVLPLLKKYGARAVFCVVGEYTDEYSAENLTYGYMRWSEINELMQSPYAEVANHSYGFHSNTGARNGSKRKWGEDRGVYCAKFRADTQKAQERFRENCSAVPYIYAYPFGAYSEESFDILKDMGFEATLSCREGVNILTHDEECLYLMRRCNRPSGISSEEFFKKIIN